MLRCYGHSSSNGESSNGVLGRGIQEGGNREDMDVARQGNDGRRCSREELSDTHRVIQASSSYDACILLLGTE